MKAAVRFAGLAICLLAGAHRLAAQPFAAPRGGCMVVMNLSDTDDQMPLWSPPSPVAITGGYCTCIGTCTTPATVAFEDNGGNAMTGTVQCGATPPPIATIGGNNTLVARGTLRMNVTNTPSPNGSDEYVVCWTFKGLNQ